MINSNSSFFYNRFALFYPLIDLFLKKQKQVLFKEINSLEAGLLLDIGIGTGSNLPFYIKHQIVGIDTSNKMLKSARKYESSRIQLFLMNGEKLNFEKNHFDYVVLSHVIAVVDNPENLINEIHRILKPNGQLIILNHFTPTNWLKYIDIFSARLTKLIHIKSHISIIDISELNKFELIKNQNIGWLSYYKLLIYMRSC